MRQEKNKSKEMEYEKKKTLCQYKEMKWKIVNPLEKVEHNLYGTSIEGIQLQKINQVNCLHYYYVFLNI